MDTAAHNLIYERPTHQEVRENARMPHAIIRGGNGRRHEVDFGDAEIRVEVYSGDETMEIVVEAIGDLGPSDRRRFALLNIPRQLFSSALGEAAQRKGTRGPRRL